ncbi:DUF4124 domain-containing protein [Kaarinaea lacus]
MKKIYISLFLLSFFAVAVQAAVYKWVDDEGNAIKYSDVPQKAGDKPIDVPPPAMEFESKTPASIPEFKPPPSSSEKAPSDERKIVTAYSAVTIMNIRDDEGIRANGGIFSIKLASQPPLDAASGDRYVVMIDGAAHQSSDSTEFQLENLVRGTHTISVQVQNENGSVLASSSPITMHVLRR